MSEKLDFSNWTASLCDRLNELARENAKYFSECEDGPSAARLVSDIHGQFNVLRFNSDNLRQRVAELEADKARIDALEAHYFIHAIANKSQPSIFYTRGFLAFEGETFREALDKNAAAMAQQKEGKI